MAITHTLVVTGTNDGTKQVSKNQWNADHTIAINTILPIPNIADNSDTTKDIQFTLSGATTAKTLTLISAHTDNRSITFPDTTGTIALAAELTDGSTITGLVNAQISASAAITLTKLEALTSGEIIVGNGSNVAAQVAMSGDITISNAVVTAIDTGVIVNGDINAAAAIDYSKLATLTDGNILVGNGSNVATSVAMSGDVAIANTGATTIQTNAVELSMVATAAKTEAIVIAASDETTALTTGTAKVTFHMPYAFTLTDIKATVTTAPTDATLIADVNDGGTTIMTTDKLDIETGETSTETAATAPALTDTALAADAIITIDIDQVGSTVAGAGLKVYLIGYQT